MKKRLLSLLLVLTMVFSLMPAALAADKPSFQSFFESVPANAETEPGSPNSTNKWKVASLDGDYVLKSGGAGKSRARSTLQLTFTADAELTFEYKVSSEPNYDYFTITYDGAEKVKESGDLGWKTYTLSAESGKVLTLTYAKDSSGDKSDDCVYVRNFTAGEATVVTFHANGGVGDDYTQNFYGQAALKLNAFTKADGVFAGWATTPDGEVAYTDGAKLNPTEAMDLYAVWTPAYTVTFAYNDGTTADTTVAIACGTAIGAGAIPQPTRTGYTFDGWFAGDTALTADTVIADDTTYTAAWTANTYTVQYLPNGGTGEMAAQTFTYDAEQALTANAFTRAGYDFRGWNTSASGSSVQYTDGAAVKNLSAENNAVVKLYAVWAGQPVQVTVNRNDGSEPTVRTGVVGYNYNYIYENGSARYNQIPDPTRTGYIFLGWTGEGITEPQKIIEIPQGSTGDRTYTANWQVIEYTIITLLEGGNAGSSEVYFYTVEQTVTLPTPTRTGYTFLGWTGEGITTPQPNVTIPKGSTGDKTYIENWELTEYNITMELNGGSGQEKVVYTMTDEDFELPTPTRNGYEFVGWTGERITTPQTSVKIPKGSTGNKAYTANWKVIRYTITLVTNGGAVIASIRYTVEDSVTLPIPPDRPGYEFSGWVLDGSGQFPSTPMIIPKGSTGDRIYKAEWRVATYTITYVSHGKAYNWVQYTINNQVYFGTPEEDPSYYLPGYTFVGWKIDGVEGTPRSYMLPKGSYGNRTATMLWEPIP